MFDNNDQVLGLEGEGKKEVIYLNRVMQKSPQHYVTKIQRENSFKLGNVTLGALPVGVCLV